MDCSDSSRVCLVLIWCLEFVSVLVDELVLTKKNEKSVRCCMPLNVVKLRELNCKL